MSVSSVLDIPDKRAQGFLSKSRWQDVSTNDIASVRWQWDDAAVGWQDYSIEECKRIEFAYMTGRPYTKLKSNVDHFVPLEVFFYDMLQHDPVDNLQAAVRRLTKTPVFDCFWRLAGVVNFTLEHGRWACISFQEHQAGRKGQVPFNRADMYKHEGIWQRMARSNVFLCISMFLVVLNMVWIGIDVEYNDQPHVLASRAHFQVPEHCFCIWFVFELSTRFAALRRKADCLKDNWFCFDAALVVLIVFDTWLLPIFWLSTSKDSDAQVRRIALFRVARVLRLTLVFRLLQFSEAVTLLRGVVQAIRSVTATLLVLLLLIYVFAIICKTLAQDTPGLPKEFYSVSGNMKVLLLQGSFIDDVTIVLDVVYPRSPRIFFLFLIFMFLSALVVLKLLIGILCDVVFKVRAHEQQSALIHELREALFRIMEVHDKDDNRTVASDEWDLIMKNPEMRLILSRCHVNINHLKDLKQVFFPPGSDEDHGISFEDVLQAVLSLRGDAFATVKNIADLRVFIQETLDRLHVRMRRDSQQELSWLCGEGTLSPTDVHGASEMATTVPCLSELHGPWADIILEKVKDLTAKFDVLAEDIGALRREALAKHANFSRATSAELPENAEDTSAEGVGPFDHVQSAPLPCQVAS